MLKLPLRGTSWDPFGRKSPPAALVAPGALGALKHDEALPLVEVNGEHGEVELG
mgnify:CR=1 FL=1